MGATGRRTEGSTRRAVCRVGSGLGRLASEGIVCLYTEVEAWLILNMVCCQSEKGEEQQTRLLMYNVKHGVSVCAVYRVCKGQADPKGVTIRGETLPRSG